MRPGEKKQLTTRRTSQISRSCFPSSFLNGGMYGINLWCAHESATAFANNFQKRKSARECTIQFLYIFSRFRRRALDRQGDSTVRRLGGLRVDVVKHEVLADGRPVALTPSEYNLLALLVEQPGRVFTRREIMQTLWQSTYVGDERACDAHVSSLRKKIELDPSHPRRVVTVPGFGYKLVPSP